MAIEPPSSPAPSIPSKSRSLRAGSVQKRLQTELKMVPKKPGLSSRAARMTKYRRKTANAKERDRMKQLNVAFDRLRGVMPDVKSLTKEEKDTKVTTLRAAISYISGLQSLLADCEAGLVDPTDFQEEEEDLDRKILSCRKIQANVTVRKKVTRVNKPGVGRTMERGGLGHCGIPDGRGGEDGKGGGLGGVRQGAGVFHREERERGIPVTLSVKTDTVFNSLIRGQHGGAETADRSLGVGAGGVGVLGGPTVAPGLNLLTLQPLPLSSLQYPFSSSYSSVSPSCSSYSSSSSSSFSTSSSSPSSSSSSPPYLPSDPSPLHPEQPHLHIGTKHNLAKQEADPRVGSKRIHSSLSCSTSSSSTSLSLNSSSSSSSSSFPSSPVSLLQDVDMFEEERSEEEESYTEDTDIEPTIDQLFQRSFSFELREMYGGGEDMEGSMVLVEGVMGTDVVILEDIASILAGGEIVV